MKKVERAMQRMTPEGRALVAAYDKWTEQMRRMMKIKSAMARMTPEGRAKSGGLGKWVEFWREKVEAQEKMRMCAARMTPEGREKRNALSIWMMRVDEYNRLLIQVTRFANRKALACLSTWRANCIGSSDLPLKLLASAKRKEGSAQAVESVFLMAPSAGPRRAKVCAVRSGGGRVVGDAASALGS
jgi:hypothetical protein